MSSNVVDIFGGKRLIKRPEYNRLGMLKFNELIVEFMDRGDDKQLRDEIQLLINQSIDRAKGNADEYHLNLSQLIRPSHERRMIANLLGVSVDDILQFTRSFIVHPKHGCIETPPKK